VFFFGFPWGLFWGGFFVFPGVVFCVVFFLWGVGFGFVCVWGGVLGFFFFFFGGGVGGGGGFWLGFFGGGFFVVFFGGVVFWFLCFGFGLGGWVCFPVLGGFFFWVVWVLGGGGWVLVPGSLGPLLSKESPFTPLPLEWGCFLVRVQLNISLHVPAFASTGESFSIGRCLMAFPLLTLTDPCLHVCQQLFLSFLRQAE